MLQTYRTAFSLAKAILMNSYVLWYETSIESEVDLNSQQATPVLEGFAPQRSSQNRIKGMEPTIIIPHPNIFVPMAHYTTRDKWHLLVSCNFSMLEIFNTQVLLIITHLTLVLV